MMDQLIQITELSFKRDQRIIFDNINMTINRGQIVAILGPSGTGKTTLLKLIAAQLYPDSGHILVNQQNIFNLSFSDLYRMRRDMGLLFQSNALFSDLSVFDNVAFAIREHTNLSESLIRNLVLMKLEAVGLRGARDLMPYELSGGMQRRVALARSIALDPSILMYDEPFTGQDPISMGVLVKLIRSLNDSANMTSIIVSHDVEETLAIVDYAYIIAQGTIIGEGTPHQLRNHASDWVKQFVQGLPDGPVPFHYPAQNYADDLMGIK